MFGSRSPEKGWGHIGLRTAEAGARSLGRGWLEDQKYWSRPDALERLGIKTWDPKYLVVEIGGDDPVS